MNQLIILHLLSLLSFIIIGLSALLAVLRIITSKTLSQRVVASDLMANLCIASIISYAQWSNNPIYLNIIIALGLVIFLSTVAYAQYIQSRQYCISEPKND